MGAIIMSVVLADVLKKYEIDSKRLQEVFEETKKKGYVSLADVPLIIRRELLKHLGEDEKNQAVKDIVNELKKEGLLTRGVLVSSDEGADDLMVGGGEEMKELRFASEDEAFQYLADLTGRQVKVARKWSGKVEVKWEPPEGFFTKGAAAIADGLHSASKTLKQAMSRLNFYINRAGENLTGEDHKRLERAKELLHKKFED